MNGAVQHVHIVCFTRNGLELSHLLCTQLAALHVDAAVSYAGRPEHLCGSASAGSVAAVTLGQWVQEHFLSGHALVYVGAAGIAVRSIAPFVKDKCADPAVLVLDEKGQFVIPLLSGHIGGANELAQLLAGITGGHAALTTATDVNALFSVDVCARKNHCTISSMEKAKRFSAALLESHRAFVLQPAAFRDSIVIEHVPPELSLVPEDSPQLPQAAVTVLVSPAAGCDVPGSPLQLVPSCLVAGVGCKKGTPVQALRDFVYGVLAEHGLHAAAVAAVASIDVKAGEAAVQELAAFFRVPALFFAAGELEAVQGDFLPSEFVQRTVGVDNVCERAAVAAGASRLLVRKTARDGMTVAVGIRTVHISLSEGGAA